MTTTAVLESKPARGSDALAAARPDDPLAMLSAALQSGQDPAKLEKLMDLAERWKADRAAEQFAGAMNECQKLMPCVVKDALNKHTSSTYARLETVQTTIRPVYTQEGFSLSYGTEDSKLDGHVRVVCDVRHVGGHKERYTLDAPLDGAGMKGSSNKTGIQATGSTISYARRYLLMMIFNLTVADQDTDGNALDALDTITEAEGLEVEDLITDSKADRERFLEWCEKGRHLVPGERLVSNIRKKSLAAVIDTLNRKKAKVAQ